MRRSPLKIPHPESGGGDACVALVLVPQVPIHFKEETISLCHPERSEGSLSGERSFAPLRMTLLKWLRLTRKTSSLKWIGPKRTPTMGDPRVPAPHPLHSRPYRTIPLTPSCPRYPRRREYPYKQGYHVSSYTARNHVRPGQPGQHPLRALRFLCAGQRQQSGPGYVLPCKWPRTSLIRQGLPCS